MASANSGGASAAAGPEAPKTISSLQKLAAPATAHAIASAIAGGDAAEPGSPAAVVAREVVEVAMDPEGRFVWGMGGSCLFRVNRPQEGALGSAMLGSAPGGGAAAAGGAGTQESNRTRASM